MIRELSISSFAYLAGFFMLGASYAWFEVYAIDRYNHLVGQSISFEVALISNLVGAAICASIFVVFSALSRKVPPALASLLLGALAWSLIYGGGIALGGVRFPSTRAFLLLFGSPLITSALGRFATVRRTGAGVAG